MTSLFLFALLATFATQTLSHSWIACTDYRILSEGDKEVYNPTNCLAFPRDWKDCCAGTSIGVDRGFDFKPNTEGRTCRDPTPSPYSNGYDDKSPMARYQPGQKVCLVWPPKNHVSATCNNPNIPDHGTKVYVSDANPTGEIPGPSGLTLVKDFGANTQPDGYIGFQNCPKFCENQDKGTCTGCFTVPGNLKIGNTYTFVWEWAFNSDTDIYSSCWEAEIVETAPASPDGSPAIIDGDVDDDESIPCSTNDDCPSNVCQINGFCMKKSGIGAGGVAAIIFALLFVAVVVGAVFLILYRYKLPSSVPTLGRQ